MMSAVSGLRPSACQGGQTSGNIFLASSRSWLGVERPAALFRALHRTRREATVSGAGRPTLFAAASARGGLHHGTTECTPARMDHR